MPVPLTAAFSLPRSPQAGGTTTTFVGFFMLHPTITTSTPNANPFPTSTGILGNGLILGVPAIAVEHGDTVTVEFTDVTNEFLQTLKVTDTLEVDTEGPEIDNVTPGDGTISTAVSTYTAEVTDEDSDLDIATISFLINSSDDVGTASPAPGPFQSLSDLDDADDVKIGEIITLSNFSLTGKVFVSVTATDNAGNVSFFDADRLTAGDQMAALVIDVDAPTFDKAFTGVGWDNIAKVLTFDDTTSIVVLFEDTLTDLDGDSVSAGDFSVVGNTVTDADVFSGSVTSSVDGLESVEVSKAVFLTLGTALTPDETPTVSVVGDGVDDEAGNEQAGGSGTASDRISPTITIDSITPELAADGDTVVIKISADEPLDNDDIVVAIYNAQDGDSLNTTIDDDGTNAWTVTTASIGDTAAFSIYVTGVDEADNTGDAGEDAAAAAVASADIDDHTIFEGDTGMPAPRVTPGDAATAVTRDPFFIIIDFGETTTVDLLHDEGSEYTGDSHSIVTLTVLTWDGVDILGDEDSKDEIRFLIAVNDIALGDHTVTVNAEDEAGNTLVEDLSFTFTVEEKGSFDIDLNPGWNLVSFPGTPADGDIDVVLAGVSSVTAIVTYDPALPGGFLSAIREEDGSFAGTLTSIVRSRGYWINAETFETLEVDIPSLEAGEVGLLPPTIAISEGWNLVPVLDVVGTGGAGEGIAAATYFGSLGNIAAVYSYDTISNTWEFLDSTSTTENVVLGRAYWVYTTAPGVLVPSGVPE